MFDMARQGYNGVENFNYACRYSMVKPTFLMNVVVEDFLILHVARSVYAYVVGLTTEFRI